MTYLTVTAASITASALILLVTWVIRRALSTHRLMERIITYMAMCTFEDVSIKPSGFAANPKAFNKAVCLGINKDLMSQHGGYHQLTDMGRDYVRKMCQ